MTNKNTTISPFFVAKNIKKLSSFLTPVFPLNNVDIVYITTIWERVQTVNLTLSVNYNYSPDGIFWNTVYYLRTNLNMLPLTKQQATIYFLTPCYGFGAFEIINNNTADTLNVVKLYVSTAKL